MKVFNESNFTDLLTTCHNRPRYKGLIVLISQNAVRNFLHEITEIHNRNPIAGVGMIYHQPTCVRMEFTNGSYIDVMSPNDSRGKRCHEVLYSQELPDDVIRYISCYEILYNQSEFFYHPAPEDISDDFLNQRRMPWGKEYYAQWVNAEVKLPDPMDEVVVNTELDNFLNEFKIATMRGELNVSSRIKC